MPYVAVRSVAVRLVVSCGIAVLLLGDLPVSAFQRGAQAPPTKPTTSPGFACPDPLAAKSCKSFDELRKAGDEGVRVSVSNRGVAYVCFRQPEDEFFVLAIEGPFFIKNHSDAITKKWVPDDDAVSEQYGFIHAYVNGIQESASAPINNFSGEWTPLFGPSFTGKRINRKEIADSDSSFISIDDQQVDAGFRYKNRLEKNIDYRLVIQRSTGRFSERYTDESSKVPFSQRNGRCSRIPEAK